VDEEAASFEYAEELAQREREELQERAKKLRIYKRDEGEEMTKEEEEEEIYINEEYDKIPTRPDQTRDITSESALTARKEYVEASRKKAKIEAEKVAEEYEARGEQPPEPYKGHALVVAKKTALEDTRKIKHDKWDKLAKEAELDTDEIQKDRSAFDRLWRPVAFGLAVAWLSWVWAESYEPPKSSMRVFPSISPGTATIVAIAGLNLLVLLMWRHPNAWKMMNRNFMLSPGSPRAFSIVGALFSHQTLTHWMWNMGALWVIGSLGTSSCPEHSTVTLQD
jgi:rhomboid-like protein